MDIVADSAFTLSPVSKHCAINELRNNKIQYDSAPCLVGMTTVRWPFPESNNSHQMYGKYITALASLIDYIVESRNAMVIIFPQVIGPKPASDDRITAKEIYNKVINKNQVKILLKDFSPQMLKGLISLTDLFIGSRMHSNIFALSSFVPTLAIKYLPKTTGIMKMVNLDDYICDIENLDVEQLKRKFDSLWQNKSKVKHDLQQVMTNVFSSVEQGMLLIKQTFQA